MLYEPILTTILEEGLTLEIQYAIDTDMPVGVWLYPSGFEIMVVGMCFDETGMFHHYTGIRSCAHPHLKYWCKIIYAYLTYNHT